MNLTRRGILKRLLALPVAIPAGFLAGGCFAKAVGVLPRRWVFCQGGGCFAKAVGVLPRRGYGFDAHPSLLM